MSLLQRCWLLLAVGVQVTTAFAPGMNLRSQTSLQANPNLVENDAGPNSILITFDLDDTLFPIKEVVQEANDAQIRAMRELGYAEATMEQCMVQTRAIRQSLTSPITYTDLRKGAIRAELERFATNLEEEILQEQAEQCFDAWLQERHAASERHLFEEAIPAMRDLQTSFADYNLCIAGITNGRGNPLCMTETLAPFFAYCVSGEDDGVFPHRKPHRQIYEAALDRWRAHSSPESAKPDVWIHVGDCLANDVGASHDAGAQPIWVAPTEPESEEQPSWSTATEKDLEERALLMEAAKSKMRGQIRDLSQLTSAVEDILREWTQKDAKGSPLAAPISQ